MQSQAGMGDLFAEVTPAVETEKLADGAFLFRRFAAESARFLVELVWQMATVSPFRHLVTPGGYRMSVAMTNCGLAGWTSDRQGYRYAKIDPETGAAWPPMPLEFQRLAETAAERAGFPGFKPECCLINRYEPGAKLSLHQDRDEKHYESPSYRFLSGCRQNSFLAVWRERSARDGFRSRTAMSSYGADRLG
jgi:DNA oxidative demethylase